MPSGEKSGSEPENCTFWTRNFLIFVAKCGPDAHSLAKLPKSLFSTRKIRRGHITRPLLSGIEHFGTQIAVGLR